MENRKKIKIGIIGSGAIAESVGRFLKAEKISTFNLIGINGIEREQTNAVADSLKVPVFDFLDLINKSELILEATTAFAMPEIVKCAVSAGKSIITMSVGGFALSPDLLDFVEKNSGNIFVPSGGVAGLDGLLALREIGLDRVELTTRKSPNSLRGAPFLSSNHFSVNIEDIVDPTTIFEGSAREAIAAFPSNANLAITLSLAGLGFDRTRVNIIADPNTKRTIQHVDASAGGCSLKTTIEGVPMAENPRTSFVALQSVKALLRKISSKISIGT